MWSWRRRGGTRRGRCWRMSPWPSGRWGAARWPGCSSPTPTIRAGRCAGRWRSCVASSASPPRCAGTRWSWSCRGPRRRALAGLRRAGSGAGPRRAAGGDRARRRAGVRCLAAGGAPAVRGRLRGRVERCGAGALAAGAPLDGAALASRALALNRFDDGAHELLVRCLARAGQVGAAREHADACEAAVPPRAGACARSGRAPGSERARRERRPAAGAIGRRRWASWTPGARPWPPARSSPAWPACGRRARRRAGVGDPALLARALAALGAALVHSVRGGDEEGAALLHEALALAEAGGDREVECKACRELGFVAVQASRGVSGRPVAGARRRAGGRTTRSARPCSACAERRCPIAPTMRRRSLCSASPSRSLGAAVTSARRRGRWRSSAARSCCAASGPTRSRCSTTRSRW